MAKVKKRKPEVPTATDLRDLLDPALIACEEFILSALDELEPRRRIEKDHQQFTRGFIIGALERCLVELRFLQADDPMAVVDMLEKEREDSVDAGDLPVGQG